MRPHIGTAVKFKPSGMVQDAKHRLAFLPGRPEYITGAIDYINNRHRYFRVRYTLHDRYINHECFKF